jgi:cation:H+ antiporter
MFEAIGFFLFGLFLLLLGGDSVVRGTSGLGQRLGLSPFLAGLLVLSFATSLPELAVNAYAIRHGQVELALGNAVGSSIANIGLTLALAAVATPLLMHMRILAAELVFVVVASGAVLFFGLDGAISRSEGGLLLLGFVAFLAFAFSRGRAEAADVRQELEKYAHTGSGLVQNLARLAIGAVVLFFASRYIVANAPVIGQALGQGPLVTGLTVVAVGTALPELATALLAARQGQGNVVAGQALGGCLFNLLFVVGGMALIQPLAIPHALVGFALPAVMALALVLYPVIAGDQRLGRRTGGLLFALFVAWLVFELAPAWR